MEHRWRDISGPDLTDDPDWPLLRTLPTFGDGTPASLAAGEFTRLSPRRSALIVWFELYDGQGTSAQPVAPTPLVRATLEIVTYYVDAAGNAVYSVGPRFNAVPNQERELEITPTQQGVSFVRITNITGGTTNPGSLRVFVDQEHQA